MTATTDPRLLLLDPADNVLVVRQGVPAGERIVIDGQPLTLAMNIGMGHKLARRQIGPGEAIVKYGAVIGTATAPIALGAHVHLHNVRSNYTATHSLADAAADGNGA